MYPRILNSGKYKYLLIQKSYWENGRSKQKTIANLGRVGVLGKNQTIKKLVKSILKYFDEDNKIYDIMDGKEEDRIYWGANAIVRKLWQELDLDNILLSATKKRKIQFDFYEAILLMLTDRFSLPCSKYQTFLNQNKYDNPDNIELHQFYRALDILNDHKDYVELELFKKSIKNKEKQIDVVFYDITTLHFESTKINDLKNFGFSKAGKHNEVQILFGLIINNEGIPIGFEIFPGNIYEGSTLETMIEKLKKRFKIKRLIFTADQGMLSDKNIKYITSCDYEYIIGGKIKNKPKKIKDDILDLTTYEEADTKKEDHILKYKTAKCYDTAGIKKIINILSLDSLEPENLTEIRKITNEFLNTRHAKNIKSFLTSSLSDPVMVISMYSKGIKTKNYINKRIGKIKNKTFRLKVQKSDDQIKILNEEIKSKVYELINMLTVFLDEKLILTWSSKRKEKNKHDRERLIEKAKKAIKTKTPITVKSGYKKYIKTEKSNAAKLDMNKIVEEEQWDGFFGIQTSAKDISTGEITSIYHLLWKIEESFKILKSHFETRPIYHWNMKRITGHLVLCFLALLIERRIENKLSEKNIGYSVEKIRKAINSLQASKIKIEDRTFYVRSPVSELASQILQALKIKAPKNVQIEDDFYL